MLSAESRKYISNDNYWYKTAIKKLTVQFFKQQEHFRFIWEDLNEETREKMLKLVASGKGLIPYENIKTFDSLDSVPKIKYFLQFVNVSYSVLKQQNVPDEEKENYKFLNVTLKMHNLSDMNDLYTFQGTCLLHVRLSKVDSKQCAKCSDSSLGHAIPLAH